MRLAARLVDATPNIQVLFWSMYGQNLGMPEDSLHDSLVGELKVVRKRGLHRLDQFLGEVPTLVAMANQATGGTNAEHVENLLRSVYKLRSEGAQGTAIGLLLGLEQGRRGVSPTTLRQVAADRLGYHSVDTFRKRPEAEAISTFAYAIESYVIEYANSSKPEDYKINLALKAIQDLTLTEYAELTRRLREWFASVNRPLNL